MSTTTKPFDYAAFIAELRVLREYMQHFTGPQRKHDSNAFKVWRHDLVQLLRKVRMIDYSVHCNIEVRRFCNPNSIYDDHSTEIFDRDLQETSIELDHIIRDYEKYGDPKPQLAEAALPKAPLKWDKEATFRWYLENTPAATLWSFAAIVSALVLSAFFAGIAVEKRLPESKAASTGVTHQTPNYIENPVIHQTPNYTGAVRSASPPASAASK